MVLTKKRLVFIAFALLAIFFILLLNLPESVVGHRGDNILLFIPQILFLAITTSIVATIIIVIIFKKNYVKSQIFTFNRYKHYLRLLIKRDFITKYRKSILGVLWSFLNPLLTMLVMTFVFQHLFRFQIDNFPVYVFSGQLIFNFFQESTTLAMNSVIASEGVIKKVYMPKYIFPLSRVLSSLVNMFFTFIAFMLVFIFTGSEFYWTMLLIPIPLIYIFVFSLGVAMLLSSLAVFFRDLTYLYGVFTLLLMFLTPIIYPVDIIPEQFLGVYGLNPMFQFVQYFRYVAMWNTVPDLWTNMVCIGLALSSLCIGTFVFMRQQDKYILSL
ncbi:MAG: ABC transporter permease [Oscillospiraceae bacterium]|nr:ABC transporter permease [Oscillospiraceae bacterium]